MTQNTILAAGQTAAASTNIVIAAGATVTVGLFTDHPSGDMPARDPIWLVALTPGTDKKIADMSKNNHRQIVGPGTYKVLRPVLTQHGVNIGVALDI